MFHVKALFEKIKKRLDSYMNGRVYPSEIATTFNFVLYDEFSKAGLEPVFVGEYFVDPKNSEQTRVFCHQGSEACSPLSTSRGIIGRAVRTGNNQYVADVTLDSEHVGCDPSMEGCEVVLVSWGKSETGERIPLGVLDIDFGLKQAISEADVLELEKIWEAYSKKIFPGKVKLDVES